MSSLDVTAPAFVEMAHRIVWATVATVDPDGRPRTRILHPYWQWDGSRLTGVVATDPTSPKRAHLDRTPKVSVTYWASDQDTCTAECSTEWILDDEGRKRVWQAFKDAPEPVRYDPAIVPVWAGGPISEHFAGLRLTPWRLRVMPGGVMPAGTGELLTWSG